MGSTWDRFADVLLQRAALVVRLDRNRAPDPMAGLKVDDDDVASLLAGLPGLELGAAGEAEQVEQVLGDAVDATRADLADDLEGDDALAGVARAARLSATEAEVLALLVAVETDPRRQRLVGYINDDVTLRRLTPWSLRIVFGGASWGDQALLAVAPGGGLRRAALLKPEVDGPWASNPLAVADAVVWWLAGDHSPDPALPPGIEILAPSVEDSPLPADAEPLVVVCAGQDRVRRIEAVQALLPGGPLLVTAPPEGEQAWSALVRQATLAGGAVALEVSDGLPAAAKDRVERARHLPWAVVSATDVPVRELPARPWVEAVAAAGLATADEWQAAFPDTDDRGYRLSADQLKQLHLAAAAVGGDVGRAMRRLAAGHIEASATRIRPSRSWDDLILDEDRMTQVRDIPLRWRHRSTVYDQWGFSPLPSTGVAALFAGPSGTGKTLAAEVVAADLGVDVYKIDLANLVSKYIGETEQNLSRVFDAAEASNVVLFFDEADALLGRRSEVSDAHDRYANIEVAYLLQRLERYEGVAVLATNLLKNIDPAFMRRLHLVIEFPMPEPPERRRIWRRSIPAGAPVAEDLDLDYLGDTFELSGGSIHNAAMTAAFLAADRGHAITMELAILALRRELHKIGRLFMEGDFTRI